MKHALFILLLLPTQTSSAQKIRFTDTSNKWHVKHMTHATYPKGTNAQLMYDTSLLTIDTFQYLGLYGRGKEYVREDTVAKKVYVIRGLGSNNDTTLQTLYDYNLVVGDTIRLTYNNVDTTRHFVYKIDSVLINNIYHRLWEIKPVPGNYIGDYDYYVIEGVGSNKGPLYPLNPVGFEQGYRLFCFSNNGNVLTAAAPYGGNFFSPQSCLSSVGEINESSGIVSISPHPASSGSIMTLPYLIKEATYTLYNSVGQVVEHRIVSHTDKLKLQQHNTGVYYYIVSDEVNGKSYRGKIVYE